MFDDLNSFESSMRGHLTNLSKVKLQEERILEKAYTPFGCDYKLKWIGFSTPMWRRSSLIEVGRVRFLFI
jgi:hypothetical protein